MDLAELIMKLVMTRRTVQQFTAEKVDRHIVEEALRLSLWVPNHKLSYPWVYTWVGDEAATRLAELSVELKQAKDSTPFSEVKKAALRAVVTNPYVISIGIRRSTDPRRQHEDFATLACSMQTAQLYLWSRGIGSKWSTGGFTSHARTYEILNLDPAQVQLEGALLIGMPAVAPKPTERPELSDVLREVT